MTEDKKTLSVYDAEADAYEKRVAEKSSPGLRAFLKHLSANSHVLDLGCGPGLSAVAMQTAGHIVDAVDGSAAMVARACANGVPARQALFSEIDTTNQYDGIWANFSLLHLPRSEFKPTLARLHTTLRAGGLFHIGMKLGKGEGRDRLERFYTYYQPDELEAALTESGFTPLSRTHGSGRGLEGLISDWMVVLAHG
ncbi:class I SAM-dependent methyltransferase [Aliiroseovarius sp. S2029]|uniref:class I SAM-dependent DNA methyltransferase n=1 Tax=Aliiroseovarius sp. S2029 TaxID=2936988 RepID=UPI0020BDB320|nr:class I SAM-dependent methyltransferase [Aliiroseovarius sp. S2029]MCK8485134.1 class I SAM-dependent methyltransferase [Aliiroseovarius sp. S2029]